MRKILYCISVLSLIISCKKTTEFVRTTSSDNDFIEFYFKASNNSLSLLQDIHCEIIDGKIIGRIPHLSKLDSLIPTFSHNGIEVRIKEQAQFSDSSHQNFKSPLLYTIVSEEGVSRDYEVVLTQFTGLPIISIQTENRIPVDSKEEYRNANMTIIADGTEHPDYNGTVRIRGRGNTTWVMDKKPYRLKLDSKAEILGMPADRDWVLLANYADKSLMRTKIAFKTSEIFELAYTPRGKFVELFLNGEHLGNYFLTEQIKVAQNRVNIDELNEADILEDKITGGYLLEVDNRLDEDNWFISTKGVHVTLKSPDTGIPEQLNYIKSYFQQAEDVLYSSNFSDNVDGYSKYLDRESFVNWYWVNELFKNNDAIFHSSVFMHKGRNERIKMGPVWDFDISGGNINYNGNNNPEGWWVKEANWIKRLFEDPGFNQLAKSRWMQLRGQLGTLIDLISETAAYLDDSQKRNFQKWKILNVPVWPNNVVLGSYQDEVQYLKLWLHRRLLWIDQQVSQF